MPYVRGARLGLIELSPPAGGDGIYAPLYAAGRSARRRRACPYRAEGSNPDPHTPPPPLTFGEWMPKIRMEQRKPQTIAYIEHTGPYDTLPYADDISRLYAWAKRHRARPGMRPMAVFLDDPASTPPERLRTQVAIPVHGRPLPADGVEVKDLPAMQVVATSHHGPAREYPATYAALAGYARERGLESAGPTIEVYTRKPKGQGAEAVITCRVQVGVRPRAAA